jgi:SAM-dependent methyltransferase
MNWLIKAALQKTISCFPRSEKINYFFRRNIAKSLPVDEETFLRMVDIGARHYEKFLKYAPSDTVSKSTFYEFGTGWHLIIPLLFFTLGIRSQIVVDITPHIQYELIQDTQIKLVQMRSVLEKKLNRTLRVNSLAEQINTISEMKQRLGITYLAPYDARHTALPTESIDFIHTTATLEHIQEEDIKKILNECYRILKPSGVISCLIDLKDHFSYSDNTISQYNFLRYSSKTWHCVNASINFQNRLRYPDYLRMINEAHFEIIEQHPERPDKRDRDELCRMKRADRFRTHYAIEDMGVKTLWVVFRKEGKAA